MNYKLKTIRWYQAEDGRVVFGYVSNQQLFIISLEGSANANIFDADDEATDSNGYYELGLRNLLGRIYIDYDTNPCFGTLEDASLEAVSLLRQAVDYLSQPIRYHHFHKGIHAYLGESKIAKITIEDGTLLSNGQIALRCELVLQNMFSTQFNDYDDNYFNSIDDAKAELERIRQVLVGRFADPV